MRISIVSFAMLPFGAALAAGTNYPILVGNDSTLSFSPSTMNGPRVGDTISFAFVSGNHSVTQSTFASPCTRLADTQASAFDSGFFSIQNASWLPPGANTGMPTVFFKVTADTPFWFHCAQTSPQDHCQAGMLFAVNAPESGNETFGAFSEAAKASNASAKGHGVSVPSLTQNSAARTITIGAAGLLLGGAGVIALLL
ncbi:hypothetical protein NM688_g6928 [Phlebia brevispora]|uniref:Uncharacterized protein n=1 Tax=Phlebia brevispora TaxID=194682 RepID=A0ACC1SAW6_9APHY|nr:hypothetical protein NM688_g6928 [Phlebia brevispora]